MRNSRDQSLELNLAEVGFRKLDLTASNILFIVWKVATAMALTA